MGQILGLGITHYPGLAFQGNLSRRVHKEIPRAQLRAAKPSLEQIFGRRGETAIAEAYEQGYRLNEIAAHLGVHYATVSRRLQRMEQAN